VCREVLTLATLQGWQIGTTRVFLRAGQLAALEVCFTIIVTLPGTASTSKALCTMSLHTVTRLFAPQVLLACMKHHSSPAG
jgi:hypothetical protein